MFYSLKTIMTKYGLVYENENNELVYTGHFIGKNHYRIKFVMYRYLKKLLASRITIMFAIYEMRSRNLHVYLGKNKKIKPTNINQIEIASINRVYKAPNKEANKFIKKIKSQSTPYTKTHEYREEYDNDELSMSETDSELDDSDDSDDEGDAHNA